MSGVRELRTLAAPTGRALGVRIPPPAVSADSKRVPAIDEVEVDLGQRLVSLEEETRARNRDFFEQTEQFRDRTQRWEAKLATETVERDEAHQKILEGFQAMLQEEMGKVEARIESTFAHMHDSVLPPAEDELANVESFVDHFVGTTAPEVIEREQKAMEKKLRGARENFDMENAKVRKREEKMLRRADEHERRTAQTFADDTASRTAKVALLREDLEAGQRADDREEEARIRSIMTELKVLQERIEALGQERETQDCTILDSMLRSQEKLQSAVITNFGANSEPVLEDEPA